MTLKLIDPRKKRCRKLNIHSRSSETENRRGILIGTECRHYLWSLPSGARSVAAAMQKSWHRHDSSFCHQLVKMSGRVWKNHDFQLFLIYRIYFTCVRRYCSHLLTIYEILYVEVKRQYNVTFTSSFIFLNVLIWNWQICNLITLWRSQIQIISSWPLITSTAIY